MEDFGIHLRRDGTVVYGLTLEAVMDRILENISLDNLARILVDVSVDSSAVISSLLSEHQRTLLDNIFLSAGYARDKVRAYVCGGREH